MKLSVIQYTCSGLTETGNSIKMFQSLTYSHTMTPFDAHGKQAF